MEKKSTIKSPTWLVAEIAGVRISIPSEADGPMRLQVRETASGRVAYFGIGNGIAVADGALLFDEGLSPKTLDRVKAWFSAENRPERMLAVIDCLAAHGVPECFDLGRLFTDVEHGCYCRRKHPPELAVRQVWESLGLDIEKPWSSANNYSQLIAIHRCVFNADYTLGLEFADGTRKAFDVADKIFNPQNRAFRWFRTLQDKKRFRKGKFGNGGVYWDDDRDIGSFELYTLDK